MESKVAKNTSNSRSLSICSLENSVAIKQVLQQQILAAMTLSSGGLAAIDLAASDRMALDTIPVHQMSDDTGVLYRSAIALKLAPLWQLPAFDIANQLTDSLAIISQDGHDLICLDFSIEVVFPGWIHFRLSDRGLATWLQHLIQDRGAGEAGGVGEVVISPSSTSPPLSPSSPSAPCAPSALFKVQYAHARCCSLLRLAHQQGLIELLDPEFKTPSWQIIEPNPIPWLNDDQGMESGQRRLRLGHPAERHLIAQIVDGLDRISNPEPVSGIKPANALSSAFEKFYSNCRIWGEVKTETPKLAQARLGLVGVTQKLLRSLLQDQLGVTAPVEL
jgi:hypothetical protein